MMKTKMSKKQVRIELKDARAQVKAAIYLNSPSTCVVFRWWKNRVAELEAVLAR